MFLQLALEYTEALNSKETPTILTALDRVVQAETVKILDEAYEGVRAELEERLSEGALPMTEKELRKIAKTAIKSKQQEVEASLASILSFKEIIEEVRRFKERVARDLVAPKC
jgi:hypothetical protein